MIFVAHGVWASVDTLSIPVGVTRFKITKPEEKKQDSVTKARIVSDSRQTLQAECPKGFSLKDVRCDLNPLAIGRSFDMGADLNPIQAQIVKREDQKSAACHAAHVNPDQMMRLDLHLECVQE